MEILRALAILCESPAEEHARIWRSLDVAPPSSAEYTQTFVLGLPPYASIYAGAEGMLGGEARDRIAGFWRALGIPPPAEPDHLAALLGLYAALADDGAPQARHARGALLHEHLLSWLPPYLQKLESTAPPPYRAWAAFLTDTLRTQMTEIVAVELPLALREAPALADPRNDGAERFFSTLLAPAASGIILVRGDLARAAQTLDLGLRAGERRYALAALFDQDPGATLRWLRDEAQGWIELHDANTLYQPGVRMHWRSRARATMELLQTLTSGDPP